MKYLLVQK